MCSCPSAPRAHSSGSPGPGHSLLFLAWDIFRSKMWLVLLQQAFYKSVCTVALNLSANVNKDDASWCVVQPEHAHALRTSLPMPPGAKDRGRDILSSHNYSPSHSPQDVAAVWLTT